MDYVISKYTYQFISSKGENIIYCSRSNSILSLSQELFKYLDECRQNNYLINSIENETLELLKKNRIIVDKNADSDYLLERRFLENQISFSTETLDMVIAPTLACNFDCPYCFEENRKSSKMNNETIDKLINFIKRHNLARKLAITWFGGEPLLAFDVIKDVMFRIKNELDITLISHSIITNGFYFTDKVIDFFKENHLNSIQISIDGKKERHDTIKIQKGNQHGTYDTIIENIDNIVERLPQTNISIRVNVDKESVNEFTELYHHLTERWRNKRVIIYPGILRINNKENTGLDSNALSQWETFELYYKLRKKNMLSGQISPCCQYHKGCSATMINSYVIGPKGEIYKCWNDVGNNQKIIGYIDVGKIDNAALFYRYMMGANIYEDSECVDCSLIPICAGKCAYYQLKNKYENGRYILCECMQKAPGLLEKSLEEYIYKKNGNEIKV